VPAELGVGKALMDIEMGDEFGLPALKPSPLLFERRISCRPRKNKNTVPPYRFICMKDSSPTQHSLALLSA
jgi:hypothetical protein